MGDVVDMTGRVIESTDPHPLGDDTVSHCTPEERKLLRDACEAAPAAAQEFADRQGLDLDDALICLIQPLLIRALVEGFESPEMFCVVEHLRHKIFSVPNPATAVWAGDDDRESS